MTHLQASYYDSPTILWNHTVNTRTEQTKFLISYIYSKISKLSKIETDNSRIIICGDFNIDAHDNFYSRKRFTNIPKSKITEYDALVSKLKKLGIPINLMLNKFKQHIPTFGVNTEDFDHVLTGEENLNTQQTIDYIWEIKRNEGEDSEKRKEENLSENCKYLRINYDSPRLECFKVDNRPYQQLSDHFGLSVELEVR